MMLERKSEPLTITRGLPVVVMVGATRPMLRKIKAMASWVLLLTDQAEPKAELAAEGDVSLAVHFDGDQPYYDALVAGYVRHLRPVAVISLTERGLVPAEMIREALGLLDNPPSLARILKDKARMRQHLEVSNAADLNVPFAVLRSREDLLTFVQRHPEQGVICKPIDGTGSVGIRHLKTTEQVADYIRERENAGWNILAEAFVAGLELSVESVSIEGTHHLISITEKVVNEHFVEIVHCTPPRELSASQVTLVRGAVGRYLDAMSVRSGPCHTEIKLSGMDVKVVESHNRVGGDKINWLTELSTGIDMVGLAFAVALGQKPEVQVPEKVAGACIRFLTPDPGTVRAIRQDPSPPDDRVKAIHIGVQVGGEVMAARDSYARSGYVVTAASTTHEAFAVAEAVARSVQIVTTSAEVVQSDGFLNGGASQSHA